MNPATFLLGGDLPVPPADVLFARYLLAHLPRPLEVVEAWGTQLARHGRLVLDEVERIDTSVSTFARYLEVAGAMIASYGADLYVGGVLRDADAPAGLQLLSSGTAQTTRSILGMRPQRCRT